MAVKKQLFNHSIIILAGGWGFPKEINHSLNYSKTVYEILKDSNFNADIRECYTFQELYKIINIPNILIFNTLYGKFGEDGRLQAILDMCNIPYTGSGYLASAIAMNKIKCGIYLSQYGLQFPYSLLFNDDDQLEDIIYSINQDTNFKFPIVIKPNQSGFNYGYSLVKDKSELKEAILLARNYGKNIIVQEFIEGKTIQVTVISGKSNIPIEVAKKSEITNNTKHHFESENHVFYIPAQLPNNEINQLKEYSERAYKALDCNGLARCDFQVSLEGEIYFLELNTQHSLRPQSIAANAFNYSNTSIKDIIGNLILEPLKSKF